MVISSDRPMVVYRTKNAPAILGWPWAGANERYNPQVKGGKASDPVYDSPAIQGIAISLRHLVKEVGLSE